MKRALPLLCLSLLLLCLLSASSPPYVTHRVEIRIGTETIEGNIVRTDLMHDLRAKKAGGYLPLYLSLRKRYSPKEALNYIGEGLGDYVTAACEKVRVLPTDATLEWHADISSPFHYNEARAGKCADADELGRAIARAMDAGGVAACPIRDVPPAVTTEKLRAETRLIGTFTTSFRTSGASRRHNIALAAAAVNGTVLEPEETFSFNGVVGARTADRGYREANIVVNGDFVKGVGGGVCQVSTTLYNAVLLAGLRVENAAAHSCPVSYVAYSRDCTVSSAIDFLFRNDGDTPVYIAAKVSGDEITFRLYGKPRSAPTRLESVVLGRVSPKCTDENGAPLEDTTGRPLLRAGREGIKSALYAVEGDSRRLLRENYYPPKNAVYGARKESAASY